MMKLIEEAIVAREKAYAPYSNFMVGAALLCADGSIYQGCNIENAAYSPSNCAERTAFFKAVSEGKREFQAIAIVGGLRGTKELDVCAPCGVCRQVMQEFCKEDFMIYLGTRDKNGVVDYKTYTLEEILPLGFGSDNLE